MANNEIRPIVQQQVAITARPEDTPSNPFYLHLNENPSLVLVSPVLSGPNFHSWFKSMRMALLSKNKLGFVDGSILIPSKDDPTYPAWQRCNTMVYSWLVRSLSPSIAKSILWLDNAVDIWKDLHDKFSQGDAIRMSEQQEEIYNFRQNSLSVTDYHTQLKILWDEYVTLRSVPVCPCEPQCSCQALKDVKKAYQNDYSIRFLKGLNDNFATVRSQIFLMDPLPNINKLFSLVLQHERQFNNPMIKLEEPASVFLTQGQ
uniref:Retrotransposon Copia-like N-terminal domain-containing protein n=1 Tax=Nelumbo nucifera TaxID=4432 RepID=A0A822ZND9_NELNU|nr:TPA_asm: hypothetical protein HUJ06_004210 [Nelumbo nucifera]